MSIERKSTLNFIFPARVSGQDHPIRSFALSMGRFTLHFLEMTVAMMAGMPIFSMLRRLIPASSNFAAAFKSGAIAYDLNMTIFMTLPMVAWMIVRKHGWRHSAEMAFGMFAPVAVIVALRWLGADAYLPGLSNASHAAMFLGMLAMMLCRRDHYIGKAGHSAHDHAAHAHA